MIIFSRGDVAKPRLYSWNNRAREGILRLQKMHIKSISPLESLAVCISGGNLQTVERFGHKIAQKRLVLIISRLSLLEKRDSGPSPQESASLLQNGP